LLIRHSKYSANTLLQTAFSAIFPTGNGELFRENIEEKGQYISSIITSAVEFKIDSS